MNPIHGIFAALLLGLAGTASLAAPGRSADACYVRTAASAAEGSASAAAAGRLGLRRKTEQLFDVDISVSGPGDATCAVSGVARLARGEPGAEVLGLVIPPDPSRKTGRSGTLCQVFMQTTAGGRGTAHHARSS